MANTKRKVVTVEVNKKPVKVTVSDDLEWLPDEEFDRLIDENRTADDYVNMPRPDGRQ